MFARGLRRSRGEAYTRLTRLGHKLDVATRSSLVTVLSVASTSPDPDQAELLLGADIGIFDTGTKHTAADEEIIDAEARCALVVATARSEQLDRALSIWRDAPALSSFSARKHTTNESKDYIGDTRAMYECLIEVCCHQDRVDDALEVFDHLKDAGARVGTVTLAFLESPVAAVASRSGECSTFARRCAPKPTKNWNAISRNRPNSVITWARLSTTRTTRATSPTSSPPTDSEARLKSPRGGVRNRDATTRESTTHTQQHATREQRELLVTKMYFIHSFIHSFNYACMGLVPL